MYTGHSLTTYALQRHLDGSERAPVEGGLCSFSPSDVSLFYFILSFLEILTLSYMLIIFIFL